MQVRRELLRHFSTANSDINRDSCGAQRSNSTARNILVGVFNTDDHTCNAGADYRIGARASAASMAARLKRCVQSRTAGICAGRLKRDDFGVRAAELSGCTC
jgi:hypothetical protein